MDAYRRADAELDRLLGFQDAIRQALTVLADRTDVPVEARAALFEDISRLRAADHTLARMARADGFDVGSTAT